MERNLFISNFFTWGKAHPLKALCISYFTIVVIKIILSQIYIDPTIGVDRYQYLKMAKSFWFNQVFIVNGEFTHKYPPLYPIAISPSFIFDVTIMITRMIRVINAFLSSLIQFPIFYIGKEFINKINSLKISIVISLIASSMLTVFFVMSENLYYPLFILTVLTLYLTVKNNFSIKFMILSGIFIGLCFLTRYTTIAMIPAVLIFFFFFEYIIKKKKVISCGIHALKNWLFINVVAGIIIFPWLVRNGVHFGFTINGIIGYTNEIGAVTTKLQHFTGHTPSVGKICLLGIEGPPLIFNFLIEIILHNAYLILGSGILFFILAFQSSKKYM